MHDFYYEPVTIPEHQGDPTYYNLLFFDQVSETRYPRRAKTRAIREAWVMIRPVISAKITVIMPQIPNQKSIMSRVQPKCFTLVPPKSLS